MILFHLTVSEPLGSAGCPASQRSVGCSHALQTLSAHSGAAPLQDGTICPTSELQLSHHSLQVLPPPHHLSTYSCPTANSRCCSLLHFPAQRLFLQSPTSRFSHTFFPGKSPEAMHLQGFSICRTRRKLPPAPLRARAGTAPLTAGTRQGMVVFCRGPTSLCAHSQTLQT